MSIRARLSAGLVQAARWLAAEPRRNGSQGDDTDRRRRFWNARTPVQTELRYGPMGREVLSYSGSAGGGPGYASRAEISESSGGSRAVALAADAVARYDVYELIARSQQLHRDNTIYRAIINRVSDFLVAEGPLLTVRSDNARQNREAERRWADWWNETPELRGLDDGAALTRHLVTHHYVDGRMGLLWDELDGRVQLVPGDRIWSLKTTHEKRRIEAGVELDALDRPLAYHLAAWDMQGSMRRSAARVPAANMYYWPFRSRIDQTAGLPALQAIFAMIDRLEDVVDSEAYAWQLLSRMALMVNRGDAAAIADQLSSPDADAIDSAVKRFATRVQDLGKAMVFHGEPGEKVSSVDRNLPGVNFGESIKMFLRLIGMELGFSLEFLLLIWSDTNYSSGRASAMQVARNLRVVAGGLRRGLGWIYRNWAQREMSLGLLPLRPDLLRHEFHFPNYPFIDPLKESEASRADIEAGLTTQQRALAERGIDMEDHLVQRAQELAAAAEVVQQHNTRFAAVPITLGDVICVARGGSPMAAPPVAPQPDLGDTEDEPAAAPDEQNSSDGDSP